MGVRFPSVASTTFIGPFPATAAETIVLTTPPLTIPLDFAQIILMCSACITAGTGVISHTFRVRRGTALTGVQVNLAPWGSLSTAGSNTMYSFWYVDTPGAVAGQQYSLTVAQNGATAAGVWVDGALLAFAL